MENNKIYNYYILKIHIRAYLDHLQRSHDITNERNRCSLIRSWFNDQNTSYQKGRTVEYLLTYIPRKIPISKSTMELIDRSMK